MYYFYRPVICVAVTVAPDSPRITVLMSHDGYVSLHSAFTSYTMVIMSLSKTFLRADCGLFCCDRPVSSAIFITVLI